MNKISSILKKQPLIFLALGFLVFVITILVITALNLKNMSEVEICVAPASAEITINGRKYQNGTYQLPVGTLAINIQKDGFEPQNFTIENLPDETTKLYTFLIQSDGANSWYEDHLEDALIVDKIGDYRADQKSLQYNSDFPIIKSLPIIYANYDADYNYTEFRIDGGNFDECKNDFCLKITDTTGGNLEAAKAQIRASGYEPNDYEILYQYTPIQPLE